MLLEASFIAVLRIALTLEIYNVIVGVQNLSFARPNASTLAPLGQFWHVGDTRDIMKSTGRARGRTRGSPF